MDISFQVDVRDGDREVQEGEGGIRDGPAELKVGVEVDDRIGAVSCSHKELEQFVHFTNTFHPNLKFSWTISDTSLSYVTGSCYKQAV
eukprot:g14010.t1